MHLEHRMGGQSLVHHSIGQKIRFSKGLIIEDMVNAQNVLTYFSFQHGIDRGHEKGRSLVIMEIIIENKDFVYHNILILRLKRKNFDVAR